MVDFQPLIFILKLNINFSSSREALSKDSKLTEEVLGILYKESKKEALEYRRHALKAYSDVLHELDINRFTQIYDIAQDVLPKVVIIF